MTEEMNAVVRVKRNGSFTAYKVACTPNTSVAKLLELINMVIDDPIDWECACRQKMCGSCAMVINGRPALACSVFVRELGAKITLEPLSKFPLIKDLRVDRSVMERMIEENRVFLSGTSPADSREHERQYLAASCLMCGCCMEVCPNCSGKDLFGGAMLMNRIYKTASQETDSRARKKLLKSYRNTQFADCSKSLSCADVCPMKLPIPSTFSRLNAKLLR